MHATVKALRLQTRALLAAVERGEIVEITYRGKACARLLPVDKVGMAAEAHPARNPAFGLWADRVDEFDVEHHVRALRSPRRFAE